MLTDADYLEVALAAADVATRIIRGTADIIRYPKGERDEVTGTDLAVERAVRAFLAEHAPGTGFLGEEEGGVRPDAELVWVLDPVDGTVNYGHGLLLYGMSLALVRDRRPVLGVIDLPAVPARYWAAAGGGAFRDGEPVTASRAAGLGEAIVAVGDFATGPGAQALNVARLRVTGQLAAVALRVRMLGTAAGDLAWTAAGSLDAMVTLLNRPWDNAAGACIALEAGAAVTDAEGRPYTLDSTEIIAGAPAVVAEIASIVRGARAGAAV
jgi:myo-inositol-1(or 4)-monophosphatase